MLFDFAWREHCKNEIDNPKVNDNHNSSEQTLSTCEITEQKLQNTMTVNNPE